MRVGALQACVCSRFAGAGLLEQTCSFARGVAEVRPIARLQGTLQEVDRVSVTAVVERLLATVEILGPVGGLPRIAPLALDLAVVLEAAGVELALGLLPRRVGAVDADVDLADTQVAQAPGAGGGEQQRVGLETYVEAQPSYSGATWVGQRTDQKTFARP